MSYESRAYDNEHGDPVVVLVTTGTHDVSRLVQLLAGGSVLVEQLQLGEVMRSQIRRHNGGRAAIALLKRHGGPDFTREGEPPATWIDPATGFEYHLDTVWIDAAGDVWKLSGWLHWTDGNRIPVMSATGDHDLHDVPLPDVIETYGPLTERLVDAPAP